MYKVIVYYNSTKTIFINTHKNVYWKNVIFMKLYKKKRRNMEHKTGTGLFVFSHIHNLHCDWLI